MGARDCGTNYKVVADQAERIESCVLRFCYQGREGENWARTASSAARSGRSLRTG